MITDVPGILVGHWSDREALTGCTVVLCPPGTVGSGEVRGGAPGTRETDLLRPGTLVQEVDAVVLSGGSAFGLAAADGVVGFLEEEGRGFEIGGLRVPIVPAGVVFDLGLGDPRVRPGPGEGLAACREATDWVEEGNAGAGAGATVAKLRGAEFSRKGGIGTASRREGDLVVGALACVNSFGEVIGEDGSLLAASRAPLAAEGQPEPPEGPLEERGPMNTTLVVVATNAILSKERANLLARAAHEGIAIAVRPSHTLFDGDAVFSLATGPVEADQRTVESLAVDAVAEAIRRGVLRAEDVPGAPSAIPPGSPS